MFNLLVSAMLNVELSAMLKVIVLGQVLRHNAYAMSHLCQPCAIMLCTFAMKKCNRTIMLCTLRLRYNAVCFDAMRFCAIMLCALRLC